MKYYRIMKRSIRRKMRWLKEKKPMHVAEAKDEAFNRQYIDNNNPVLIPKKVNFHRPCNMVEFYMSKDNYMDSMMLSRKHTPRVRREACVEREQMKDYYEVLEEQRQTRKCKLEAERVLELSEVELFVNAVNNIKDEELVTKKYT